MSTIKLQTLVEAHYAEGGMRSLWVSGSTPGIVLARAARELHDRGQDAGLVTLIIVSGRDDA